MSEIIKDVLTEEWRKVQSGLIRYNTEVPLMLVGSPKYGQKNSEALQPVKEIAENYNVRFLDYYAEPSFMAHKEWFKEPMHLNSEGARVFTKMIANDISVLL